MLIALINIVHNAYSILLQSIQIIQTNKLNLLIFNSLHMGVCQSRKDLNKRSRPNRPIKTTCPICEYALDTKDNKPYQICKNLHVICSKCMDSMKKHAALRRSEEIKCPFCKQVCTDSKIKKDSQLYQFLNKEKTTLNSLPHQKKKLFAFSTIYLPNLSEAIKRGDDIGKIQKLRINGKMLEEYEVFEMEMLECLPLLKKLYLNNNHIKVIDTKSYNNQRLQILDVGNNSISALKVLLSQNSEPFKYLKILIVKKNQIQQIGGLQKLQMLQILDMSYNKITKMQGLQGLLDLKQLNLQFNNIQQFEYISYFNCLNVFSLYGNKIQLKMWDRFIGYKWDSLKLLTMSVFGCDLIQKYQFFNRIKTKIWSYLRIIISQASPDQIQNNDRLQQFGFQEEYLNAVQINISNYQFYLENQPSFLLTAMKLAKKYNKFGENINFRSLQYNKSNYLINERSNSITKLNDANQPTDYLYHYKAYDKGQFGKRFMMFKAKTDQIVIGVCEMLASTEDSVQIDFQDGKVYHMNSSQEIKQLRDVVSGKGEYECILSFNFIQKKLHLIINSKQILQFEWKSIGEQVKFFLNLKKKDESIRLIKLYTQES